MDTFIINIVFIYISYLLFTWLQSLVTMLEKSEIYLLLVKVISLDLRTNLVEGRGVKVRENGTASERPGRFCSSCLNTF